MRHSINLALRPLRLIDRLWYWSIRLPAPGAASRSRWTDGWVRLLPQSWTRLHRAYAQRHNLLWLPCVLCDRYHGGHQMAGTIPDPTADAPWQRSIGICPACTRAGRSWRVPHPLESVLDNLRDQLTCEHEPLVQDCTVCVAYDKNLRAAFADWNAQGH